MSFPSLITTLIFSILTTTTFLTPIECSQITPLFDEEQVTKICKKTPYFDTCMTLLVPDPRCHETDLEGLAKIVMEKGLLYAKEIQEQAQSLAHDKGKPPGLRSKCSLCAVEYHEIVSELIPKAIKLVDGKKYEVSIQELKSTARKARACDEQFQGKGKPPILNMSVHDISLIAGAILKMVT